MTRSLILGGARSGKSRHAENLAQSAGHAVTVIVTAFAGDEEMAARIAHHRQRRPVDWEVAEVPIELGAAIEARAEPGRVLLVDCLTLWLSNLLHADMDADGHFPTTAGQTFHTERARFMDALALAGARGAEVLLVANEVGMGITPLGALTRVFVDEAGRLNQDVAALCECVTWVTAGLPMKLKG